MMSKVTYESQGAIGYLTMDDGKVNAIENNWCLQFAKALDQAESDQTKMLVIRGRAGIFSAGLDIKTLPYLEPSAMYGVMEDYVHLCSRLFLFPKPTISVSAGHCFAAGMILFLATDARLAINSADYLYSVNEVLNGVPVIGVPIAICHQAIPTQFVTEMVMHAREYQAKELQVRHVINHLCDDETDVTKHLEGYLDHFSKLNLSAYHATKKTLRQPLLDTAIQQSQGDAQDLKAGNVLASFT